MLSLNSACFGSCYKHAHTPINITEGGESTLLLDLTVRWFQACIFSPKSPPWPSKEINKQVSRICSDLLIPVFNKDTSLFSLGHDNWILITCSIKFPLWVTLCSFLISIYVKLHFFFPFILLTKLLFLFLNTVSIGSSTLLKAAAWKIPGETSNSESL